MKLDCYLLDEAVPDIRPSSNRREWMDLTRDRYAYRCLPLSIANAHGWVICCGGSFEAEWNGGDAAEDVQIFPLGDGPVSVEAHFGYGIVTLSGRAMFRTETGYNLWISGPPNHFKDGIQALSAVIEADWMPYTFSMNWKITRVGHRIRFQKGEPYCFLFPVKRGLLEGVNPALRRITEDAEGKRLLEYAARLRDFLSRVKSIRGGGDKAAQIANEKSLHFQGWYMRGEMPDGSGTFEPHQKGLQLRPFEDLRESDTSQGARAASETVDS